MEYLPVVSIIIAISGFLYQQFGIISGIKERLTSLETKMDLFWKGIEQNVIGMLKNYPTNINKDVLIDKMARGELSQEEAERLRTMLVSEVANEKGGDGKKIAYILAIGRLEQIIFEIRKNKCKQ